MAAAALAFMLAEAASSEAAKSRSVRIAWRRCGKEEEDLRAGVMVALAAVLRSVAEGAISWSTKECQSC